MIELSTRQIDATVVEVLSKASAQDNQLFLGSEKLDRKLYEATNKVITAMGGKWIGRKVQAHVFEEGTDVSSLLDFVLEHGKAPAKNPLAFFQTPPNVIEIVEKWMSSGYFTALEPSCGEGAFLPMLKEFGHSEAVIDAVEIDAGRSAKAAKLGIGNVITGDFLAWASNCTPGYQVVVMNPPFSVKGNALVYVDHIEAAYSVLASGGRLLAIAPAGLKFRNEAKVQRLRDKAVLIDLPENAFSASGTGVATVLAVIDKP